MDELIKSSGYASFLIPSVVIVVLVLVVSTMSKHSDTSKGLVIVTGLMVIVTGLMVLAIVLLVIVILCLNLV